MNVDRIFSDAISKLIGLSINVSPFSSPASHPYRVSLLVMIPARFTYFGTITRGPLSHRGSTKFGIPNDQRILQKTTLFQILEQSSNRLVHLFSFFGKIIKDSAMVVPALIKKLHESHTTLYQTASQQTIICETALARLRPIHFMNMLRLTLNIH